MRTRKLAPALTARQRRRQIIDLLARHLACMPEALAVSALRDRETDSGKSYGRKSQNLAFLRPTPPAAPGHGSPEEKLSESSQTRLDVPAEMPLSVTCPGHWRFRCFALREGKASAGCVAYRPPRAAASRRAAKGQLAMLMNALIHAPRSFWYLR